MIKIGYHIPDATLTETTQFGEVCPIGPESCRWPGGGKGKRVVIFGVPGRVHAALLRQARPRLPRNLRTQGAEGRRGVVLSLNDGFVMAAWGTDQKAIGKIRMLGDGNGELTMKLGIEADLPSRASACGCSASRCSSTTAS